MSWVLTAVLALAAFGAIFWLRKPPRQHWEYVAAALLLGIAGYGLQGSPSQPASPKAPAQEVAGASAAMVAERRKMAGDAAVSADNWIVIGDALARNGRFADAAGVMLGAVEKQPKNGEAWLAMANALTAHADGLLTPPALHAFQKAEMNSPPGDPGPPFFLGMALAQTGRLAEARGLWSQLLEKSPKEAPWRADLEDRLNRLDAFIAEQQASGGMP